MPHPILTGDRVAYSRRFIEAVAKPAGARVEHLHGEVQQVDGGIARVLWDDGNVVCAAVSNLRSPRGAAYRA